MKYALFVILFFPPPTIFLFILMFLETLCIKNKFGIKQFIYNQKRIVNL